MLLKEIELKLNSVEYKSVIDLNKVTFSIVNKL